MQKVATFRKERVRDLHFGPQKLKPREIALLLGLSTQRVYQILAELREEQEATA